MAIFSTFQSHSVTLQGQKGLVVLGHGPGAAPTAASSRLPSPERRCPTYIVQYLDSSRPQASPLDLRASILQPCFENLTSEHAINALRYLTCAALLDHTNVSQLLPSNTSSHLVQSFCRTSSPHFVLVLVRNMNAAHLQGPRPASIFEPVMTTDSLQHLSRDTCDRRRPQEEDDSRLVKMPSDLAGKTVSPFLKEHIPGLYAPIGKANDALPDRNKDPNSRYCYRHRPDSKCRRAADESKMGTIQRVCLMPLFFLFLPFYWHRLMSTGPEQSSLCRPRGHHPRVVSVFCRPRQASRAHAPGHHHAMLLPSTFYRVAGGSRAAQD